MSSWIGDTTILVASIKYKALKLQKVIVVIIQHIAVCDLMLSTGTDFIRLLSLLFDGWVLGIFLCHWFVYQEYYLSCVTIFLICTMTTSKLLLLKYPLRIRIEAHRLCSVCWILALIAPISMLVVDAKDFKFLYTDYACAYRFSSEVSLYLRSILAFPLLLAPICLVIVTSINLLVIAKRVAHRGRDNLKWQGIVTTALTATVFCISYLPFFAYLMMESIVDEKFKSLKVYNNFYRVTLSCSNFYIYNLTVRSFRSFVSSRLQLSFQKFVTPIRLIQVW